MRCSMAFRNTARGMRGRRIGFANPNKKNTMCKEFAADVTVNKTML